MTDKTTPLADPLGDAIRQALEAATLATNAAHEAEAVLIARSDAAKAMDRTARRSGLMAAIAGGASVLVLVLGGMLWLRSSADLRDAGEVQAAAAVGFAERIAELNATLDRMDLIVEAAETGGQSMQTRLTGLVEQLDARVEEIMTLTQTDPDADPPMNPQIESLRADILEAVAETQISLTERLAALPMATAAAIPTAAAPAATPVAASAAAPASGTAPSSTPARQKKKPEARKSASAPPPNPFRYP